LTPRNISHYIRRLTHEYTCPYIRHLTDECMVAPQGISKFHTATPIPSPRLSRTVPNRYSVFQIHRRLRLAPPLAPSAASAQGHLHRVMPPPPRASAPPHWLPSTLACTPSMPLGRFCYSGAGPPL
jgi:hypothetical protein